MRIPFLGIGKIQRAMLRGCICAICICTPTLVAMGGDLGIRQLVYPMAQIPYDASTGFTTGGNYYLYKNETAPITITQDNVTLDLNGFTAGGGVSVSGKNNIVIKNGLASAVTISFDSSFVRVENILASGKITCLGCSKIEMIHCFATGFDIGNGLAEGIVNYISLIGCEANQTALFSFSINLASNVYLERCIAKNGGIGFYCPNGDSHIIFKECTAQQFSRYGFKVENFKHLILEKCVAESNSGDAGFDLSNSDLGIVRECTAYTEGFPGFIDSETSSIRYVANAAYGDANTAYSSTSKPFWPVDGTNSVPSTTPNYWNNVYLPYP